MVTYWNLSEEANIVITLFNPSDEKYNLTQHFGLDLKNYPDYRSIHVVDSRDTPCPQHIKANFYHNRLFIEQIDIETTTVPPTNTTQRQIQ